jgi:hypothetical protein
MTSFTKKQLELTITLGVGEFGEGLGDTVTLSNFRMTADMTGPVGATMAVLQMRIFGLSQETMSRLTVIGPLNQARPKSRAMLSAGDEVSNVRIFEGIIHTAWADYASAPDVAFNIIAVVALDLALKPVDAISYAGATDVVQIMQDIADAAKMTLVDHGVKAQLASPYFWGTALAQINSCAIASGIMFEIEQGSLHIWPANGSKSLGDPLPAIDNTEEISIIAGEVAATDAQTIDLIGKSNAASARDDEVSRKKLLAEAEITNNRATDLRAKSERLKSEQRGPLPAPLPLVSAETGMVGYPAFSTQGATITTLFNPAVKQGGMIHVDSSLPGVTGDYNVITFSHSLSCELAGGPWFTTIQCFNPNANQS